MATAMNPAIAHAQDFVSDVIPTQQETDDFVAAREALYDPANILANKIAHGKTSITYPGY